MIDEFGIEYNTATNQPGMIPDDAGYLEQFGTELGKGIVRGFLNVGSGVVGTTEWLIPGEQESLIGVKENIESAAAKFPQEHKTWAGWGGRIIGEAFPYMGASIVAGYAGGGIAGSIAGRGAVGLSGQAAAMTAAHASKAVRAGQAMGVFTTGFAVEGQQAYDEAIKNGASENEANAERLITGTIVAAIETAQIGRLFKFKDAGGASLRTFIKNVRGKAWDLVQGDAKKFTGQVLRLAMEEGLEEFAQEGVQISVPGILRKDWPKKEDGSVDWSQIIGRMGGAFAGGALAGSVYGGAGSLISAAPEIGRPSELTINEAIERVKSLPISKKKGQPGISKAEKDLFIEKLERYKREGLEEENTLPFNILPEPQQNIYQIEGTDELYVEPIQETLKKQIDETTPITPEEREILRSKGLSIEQIGEASIKDLRTLLKEIEQQEGDIEGSIGRRVVEEETEYYLKETGQKLIPRNELSRQTGESVDDYLNRVAPLLSGHGLKNELPALNEKWDEQLVQNINHLDTILREEHIQKIKRETGIRTSAAEEILKSEDLSPRASFIAAKEELKGEKVLRFDPIKFDENQIDYYYQRIRSAPELSFYDRLAAEEGLNAIFGFNKDKKGQAKLPEPEQIKQLETVFGPQLAEALFKLRGDTKKISNKIMNTLNIPRVLLASFDISAAGRQGLLLLPIAPKEWLKSVWAGYRAFTSPEYSNYSNIQIKSDPAYKPFKKYGGFLSEVGSLTKGEELFSGNIIKGIPGIKASERAYSTTLNNLRFSTFKKYHERWMGAGKSPKEYRMLVNFINHATGRGSAKSLEKFMPALNAAFFAPKLQIGRVQSIADLFKGVNEELKTGEFSATRRLIAADLMSFFLGGMGVLWLLSKMKGVDVEHDPRSSDFGKIRFGNTRIDFWAGYSPIVRFVAQLVTAQMKGTDTKRVMPLERGDIIWRFIQTKLSPATGMAVDLIRGETFLGEQLEATPEVISKQAFQRFTPLFIQDVIDAARYQGVTSAAIVAPLAAHGVGAMTYPIRPSSEAARLKDSLSRQKFGVGWDELSPTYQNWLKENSPEIELYEKKARLERENFGMVAKRLEEQRRGMNKIIKTMPTHIKEDIEKLNVYIPGISRYISNGWYLNDRRYNEYKKQVKKEMVIYLSKLKRTKAYKLSDDNAKALLIEEVVGDIKKMVKERLLEQATIEDLRRQQ